MTATLPAPAAPRRHPVDEALDAYSMLAAQSGEEVLVEDAARQHLIRGHRWFDSLVTMIRVSRIPIRSRRRAAPHVDKLALTGAQVPEGKGDHTPAERAEHLARLIADDLHLPRSMWAQRILILAAEYAREDAEPHIGAHRVAEAEAE